MASSQPENPTSNEPPVLNFGDKKYDLNKLPDETKQLVQGMRVADAQLKMHEDTMKLIALGRKQLALELSEKLKDEKEI